MKSPQFGIGIVCGLILTVTASSVYAVDAGKVDFNRQIRPLLSKYCFACHGQDEHKREAGLRLDDRDSALNKLESGEIAIVPGNPQKSELFRRVSTQDDDLRMPPAETGNQLSADEIAVLKKWIEQQASYSRHWSFVSPERPSLPQVKLKSWPRNGIDYFVLTRLETEGLRPSPAADRYTLLRRVSLDLRGLPPSPQEVELFIKDHSPYAYEKMVDRILDDTAYGEHWAGMWLDLARYADSRGYGSDPLRPNIWRYRDWVIDAFNRNLPYDQFTIEQLAGDLLPNPTLEQKIATAFHRNTMTNTEGGTDDEEFRVAAVRDRVDTTIQVWMGLTMGCGKCHSHKYDPITQKEYYQFYDFFNQTADADRPDESPVIEAPTPELLAQRKEHDAKIAPLKKQFNTPTPQLAKAQSEWEATLQKHTNEKPKARFVRIELPGKKKMLSLAEVQVFSDSNNVALKGKATQSSIDYEGKPERALDGNTDGHYFDAKSTTHTKTETNPWWEVDLGHALPIEKIVVWNRTDGNLQSRLSNFRVLLLADDRKTVWKRDETKHPNPNTAFTPAGPRSTLSKDILAIIDTPADKRTEAQRNQLAAHYRSIAPLLNPLRNQIAKLEKSRPKFPTVPVMQELPPDKRRKTHIMVKGNFLVKGDEVSSAVPAAFHPLKKHAPNNRLGAAMWLVDNNNPLTARVFVNRFWAQIFGVGLVETEEDFGTQGEPPSHPDLLDWMATEFLRQGWDVKAFLKLVVMSATYRQSSRVTPELLAKDPRNRLLGRASRFRLDAEIIRDQALALSGLLSRKTHGPSVYPPQPPGLWRAAFNGQRTWPTSKGEDRYRRGLYTFWRRTVPYPSMSTFDAPSRELCSIRRIRTNTPLQAFVMLNDPVYVEAAQALARRIVTEGGRTPKDRIRFALQLCTVRPPKEDQVNYLLELYESELDHYRTEPKQAEKIATDPLGPLPKHMHLPELAAWTVVANVLLNLDEVITKQ
ncbi:MAG: DUF1553 domain-containing protein [Planctomycetes bacterium]|nr:DUF1553 domain-containing protein [Planctomycetota bacterium]